MKKLLLTSLLSVFAFSIVSASDEAPMQAPEATPDQPTSVQQAAEKQRLSVKQRLKKLMAEGNSLGADKQPRLEKLQQKVAEKQAQAADQQPMGTSDEYAPDEQAPALD